MRSLILGTAGHIDHGKTALVRALTGVDTDRLAEEKARGITIDLGFAELVAGDVRYGVVDVPGHEGFVRNMLAGATGMDVVLLVVAADEGAMPQTREHLAIVELLGVRRVVVALTKADLVEEEWLELAREDVADLLAGTPYADAPVIATSSATGAGLDALRELLGRVGSEVEKEARRDVVCLPVDRVFTVRGTGTVVTGTLWSGRVGAGDRVRILPGGGELRVRGVQVHGSDAEEAAAGSRVALALTGDGGALATLRRGAVVTDATVWEASAMLTAHLRVLPDAGWALRHGQRVRVHLGTAEVMARCVLLGRDALEPGEAGWGQLRLEAPAPARARQRFVLRSYSPVITFAGGEVAEVAPRKRRRREGVPEAALEALRSGGAGEAVAAALALAGPVGVAEALLPVATGLPPDEVAAGLESVGGQGALPADGRWVAAGVVGALAGAMAAAVDAVHRDEAYRPGLPVEQLRALAPTGAPRGFADAVLARLTGEGRLRVQQGVAARPDFTPTLSPAQTALREQLRTLYREAGLQPPAVEGLPAALREDPAFPHILRGLEAAGEVVAVDQDLYMWGGALAQAAARTVAELGGRAGLGPADFREVLPVSRRYLLPVLRHFDGIGVTRNIGDVRVVLKKSS
ncbi:MAG: selenocysteine-specific translation elongation factor [Longimicrobiales bacterium]|nr:selenocysteine-specific translation elongation factor [Longimicrobiales bacterium]